MRKDGFNKKGLCRLCKEPRTEKGHDPCIADLPGIQFACCGHGIGNAYLKFEDGRCLYFTPKQIDLKRPKHYWVKNPIPVLIRGDKRSLLNFKTGKKKKEKMTGMPIERDGWKLIKGSD